MDALKHSAQCCVQLCTPSDNAFGVAVLMLKPSSPENVNMPLCVHLHNALATTMQHLACPAPRMRTPPHPTLII